MKAHVIKNNIVTNTIVVDSLDFMPNLVEATEGGIGWSYVDGIFIAPIITFTAKEIRASRDSKLTESDWTQVADAPVDQAAWATYRQALRDIPTHANFPNLTETDWPTKPE